MNGTARSKTTPVSSPKIIIVLMIAANEEASLDGLDSFKLIQIVPVAKMKKQITETVAKAAQSESEEISFGRKSDSEKRLENQTVRTKRIPNNGRNFQRRT